jgi:hypothetical protein
MQRQQIANVKFACLCTFLCGFLPTAGEVAEYDLRGQVSGCHIEARSGGERYYRGGIRYIPQLSLKQPAGVDSFFELEISLNGFAAVCSDDACEDSAIELYRLKLRFATAQTETRIGLQKLSFGPSYLLRSLMWFDRLDPRDPLQLTDGVYALRFKYNALNNAGLWLWGLYGNEERKGYEIFPTADERPEFGGRLQYPVPRGEMAFTFHTRQVDAFPVIAEIFTENRFAIDGRWDVEVGLWLESVLEQQRSEYMLRRWTKKMTIGIDYTLGIGSGLHALCEHMAVVASGDPLGWDDDDQTSALSLNYPFGYLDNLSAMGFYSWERDRYYQYLSWQRTWDNLILNISIFHYPDNDGRNELHEHMVPVTGTGGQIVIVYNH